MAEAPSLGEWDAMLSLFHEHGEMPGGWPTVHVSICQRLLSLEIRITAFNELARYWRDKLDLQAVLDDMGFPYQQSSPVTLPPPSP